MSVSLRSSRLSKKTAHALSTISAVTARAYAALRTSATSACQPSLANRSGYARSTYERVRSTLYSHASTSHSSMNSRAEISPLASRSSRAHR